MVGQSVASGDEVESGTAIGVKIAKAVQTVQIPTDIVGKA
ncbi:hypothetical protein [Streptomyces sp. MBT65]